jgi:magnesium transporter
MRGVVPGEGGGGSGAVSVELMEEDGSYNTELTPTILFGICLSVLASMMNSTGLNLQRYAKTKEKPFLNFVGIFLSTVCGLVDMCSFHYAPQSLLAPIGAMTLVFNLMLAPVMHGEMLGKVDFMSTFFVFGGTVTCLYFGSRHKETYSLEEISTLASRPIFRAYVVFIFVTVVSLAMYLRNSEILGRGALRRVGVGYPVCAGILGGVTVLTVRTVGEIFKSPDYTYGLVGMLVMLLVMVAASQVFVLNRGLGRHSSLLIIPVFTGTFITSNIIGGGILYNEFARASPTERNAYFLGLSMVISGVLFLTSKEQKAKKLIKVVETQ